MGKPLPASEIDAQMRVVSEALAAPEFRGGVSREQMPAFVRRARLPLYWKHALFQLGAGPAAAMSTSGTGNNSTSSSACLTADRFLPAWRSIISVCHDDAARFVRVLVTVSAQQTPARHNASLNSSANMFWSFANPVAVTTAQQRPSTSASTRSSAASATRSKSSSHRDYLVPDDLIELIQARTRFILRYFTFHFISLYFTLT